MSKAKTILLISLMTVSLFMGPLGVVRAQGAETPEADPNAIVGNIGPLFGLFSQFGPQGALLGQAFQMMFENVANLSSTESDLPGVYVMSGQAEEVREKPMDVLNQREQKLWFPLGAYSMENASTGYEDEQAYVFYNNTGTADITIENGVMFNFIIWDWDASLVTAVDRVIKAIQELQALNGTDQEGQAAAILIEAVTYLLIHVNEIITGDELIILNMITYTNVILDYEGAVKLTWYSTVDGEVMMSDEYKLDTVFPGWQDEFNATAQELNDGMMMFLLDQGQIQQALTDIEYTHFSFDIIEIYLKHFEVHVDVAAAMAAMNQQLNGTAVEDIFKGLNIEFYIMTHHFVDFFLYDDLKYNSTLYSEEVQALANNGVPDVVWLGENSTSVRDTEITHYMVMRGGDFEFNEPTVVDGELDWGFTASNVGFRVIPVGFSPEDCPEAEYPILNMESFSLGFSFAPTKDEKITNADYVNAEGETTMGNATVKLVQSWSEWSSVPGYITPGYDLAAIYMSTILHVALIIENGDLVEQEASDSVLMDENNYHEEDQQIRVGNKAADNPLPLAEIDIAGPSYIQDNGVTNETYPASTQIVPIGFASYHGQGASTYQDEMGGTNVISGVLTIEFSVLAYAVCYPTFDGTGDAIEHDPTFSVFITFSSPGFMAIILVVGVVALVGIAAVLIQKKKQG